MLRNPTFLVPVLIFYFASIYGLVCGYDERVPINYVLLAVFTLCVSWLVGMACAKYDAATVIEAAFLTAAVCGGLIVYAMTTKNDFTFCGPVLYILAMLMLTF